MTHVVGKPAPSSQRLKQLGPSVLVTGATVMQNSLFSSLVVAVAITSTHCTYSRRDGQVELTWVAGYTLIDAVLTHVDKSAVVEQCAKVRT